MVAFAALLVPATIAACAAGSDSGPIGTTAGIIADTGAGESGGRDGGGTAGDSSGTGSGGGSDSGSSGSTSNGTSDASSSDAASSDADDASSADAASAAPDAAPDATDASALDGAAAGDGSTASCAISVTKNTYDKTYDGYITYLNTGAGTETDPTVRFTVPSGATIDTSGCMGPSGFDNQTVPSGITALSCAQSGTTVSYAFTGTMPTNAQIALYYTTNLASEAAATDITVTAPNCP